MVRKGKRSFRAAFSRMPKLERVVSAAASAARLARTLTRTRTALQSSEGATGAITSQHDKSLLYKRRRAPARVRRRARNKAASRLKTTLSAVGNRNNTFPLTRTLTSTANNQHLTFLYSGALQAQQISSESCGSIYEIFQNLHNQTPENINQRLYLSAMRTDYTIVNSGDNTVELDVYEFSFRKDFKEMAASQTVPLKSWVDQEMSEIDKMAGATNKQVTTNITFTPFQCPSLMRKVIIHKKTRFYIGGQQAISFVRRHVFKKPVLISGDDFDDPSIGGTPQEYLLACKRSLTRGLMLIQKGLPSATNDTADASTMRVAMQTNYKFKNLRPDWDENADGY